jgi:hypothetical protein
MKEEMKHNWSKWWWVRIGNCWTRLCIDCGQIQTIKNKPKNDKYKNWKICWFCGHKTKKKDYIESPKNHIRKAPVCCHCQPNKIKL